MNDRRRWWSYVGLAIGVGLMISGFALMMLPVVGAGFYVHDNPTPRPDVAGVGRACMAGDQAACHEYLVVKDAAAAWQPTISDYPGWWLELFWPGMMILVAGALTVGKSLGHMWGQAPA